MALYATKNVSQAAALALRQLQDQLSVAYTDNAKLQQERSDLRAEMHTVAEAQKAELEQSQADSTKLAKQVTEMHTMLEEMRDALETTADENAQLSRDHERSSKASVSLEQKLETSRRDLEHAQQYSREMSARMASAHLMTQNAEAASAQQLAAAASAERKAEKLDLKLADVQWELEQCQRQLKDKTAEAEQQLKERDAVIGKLRRSMSELSFKCEAATAQAEASHPYQQRYTDLQEELRQEHGERVSAEALVEQHKQQLADLKLEASVLRQASAEHAREMKDMRVATEKAETFLHHERGMCTALGDALRRTEKSMERVLGLNQSLVDSFTRQQPTPDPSTEAVTCTAVHTSPSKLRSGLCSPRHLAVPVRLPAPLLPRPTPQPHRHHCDRHQVAAPLPCTRQQAQRCKGHTSGAAAPGQSRGQSRGLLGPVVPRRDAKEGTKSRQGQEAKVARKGSNGCRALIVTRQQEEAWQTRQQVASVLLSLEDELAVLDLRYADLLQFVQTLSGSDEEDVEMQHEDLSRSVGQVLESMQRKGQQIQQLREYSDMLPV
ncbi:hypothetical protein WJX77_006620 [Trebouxia sp. C0004]